MKIIITIIIGTAIGLFVAWGGSQDGTIFDTTFGAVPVFLLCGILAYVINWIVFIPASIAQTEKYYDLTGSLTYLTIIIVACLLSPALDLRAGIVAAMVAIWAIRLGTYLFSRISADGKDGRFDDIKNNKLSFLRAWTLQGTWVILTAASALLIITTTDRQPIGVVAIIGFAMWGAGFAIEVIADRQKAAFRSKPENKDRFITEGLWSWSRHPNYFGEILLWSGITVASLPLLSGWQWLTIISPIFVTFLLTKVSGIPMLERRGKKKWGDEKAYQDYLARTNKLIPMPPKG